MSDSNYQKENNNFNSYFKSEFRTQEEINNSKKSVDELMAEFQYSCDINKGNNKMVRTNYNQINHITSSLIPYYPGLGSFGQGKAVNFMLFLLEKSLKQKLTNYVASYEAESLKRKEQGKESLF